MQYTSSAKFIPVFPAGEKNIQADKQTERTRGYLYLNCKKKNKSLIYLGDIIFLNT